MAKKLLEELRENREKIYEIAAKYGVSNIRVFGSVARGEERVDSDIDFLAEVAKGTSFFALVRLEKFLEKETGHRVQIVSDKALNRHIREKVLTENIAL